MAKRKKTTGETRAVGDRLSNPPLILEAGAVFADREKIRADAAMRASNAIAVSREQAWSHNMINGAIIGHLLVAWPMVLAAFFFFMTRDYNQRGMAIVAVALGAFALFAAWLAMAAPEKGGNSVGKSVAAFLTLLSWAFVLGCALQFIR